MSLSQEGILLSEDQLLDYINENQFKLLLKSLTSVYKNINGIDVRTQLYNRYSKKFQNKKLNFIKVPRFTFSEDLIKKNKIPNVPKIIKIINNIPVPTKLNFKFNGSLLPNQKIITDYLIQNIYTEKRTLTGHASCNLIFGAGGGKTYVGMYMIGYLSVKTLIILPPTGPLFEQWQEELAKVFPEKKIGVFGKGKKEVCDITVALINSAMKFTKEFLSQFGFIIYDEVHKYCSAERTKVMWMTNVQYTLGMTASLDKRKDMKDFIYKKHLGEPIIAEEIPGYTDDGVIFSANVKSVFYNGDNYYTEKITGTNGLASVPKIINRIISDPKRNKLIVDQVIEILTGESPAKNIYVFTHRRSFNSHLQKLIVERVKELDLDVYIELPEDNINVMMGGASKDSLKKLLRSNNKSSVIITTFNYCTEGVSISCMNALVIATPQKAMIDQVVGRILRRDDPNWEIPRTIVDIVDNRTILRSQFYVRKREYLRRNFSISKEEISFDEINYDEKYDYISPSDDGLICDELPESDSEFTLPNVESCSLKFI